MGLSIGQIAGLAGVNASAIRYYEQAGLIRPPARSSGRRVYDKSALAEITFVVRARSAGLGIDEIRRLTGLLGTIDPHGTECAEARSFAQEKIAQLDHQIAQAQALRSQLADAAQIDCTGQDRCLAVS